MDLVRSPCRQHQLLLHRINPARSLHPDDQGGGLHHRPWRNRQHGQERPGTSGIRSRIAGSDGAPDSPERDGVGVSLWTRYAPRFHPLPPPSCEDEISLESFPDSVPLQESVPASSASSIYLIKSHPTGGAANVGKPSANDIIQAKIENAKWDLTGRGEAPIDHEKLDYRGWADKGRDMIFGRKKK